MTYLLNKWTQLNASNRVGNIEWSKNIDLDLEGYLKLARRSRSIMDDDADGDFGLPIGMVYLDSPSRYYVLTSDEVFYVDDTLKTVTQDTSTNVPTPDTDGADIIMFNGEPHISAGTTHDLRSFTGSQWSTAHYSLSDNFAPMAVFENLNALAIGQDNTVLLLDTSYALLETLTLPQQFRVQSMDWSDNFLWIGANNLYNGETMLFTWDGASTSANNGFPVGASRIDSVKRYRGTVALFTGDGRLLAYNGGGFSLLGALPAYYRRVLIESLLSAARGITSHRGMVVDGDRIYVQVKSLYQTSADNVLQKEYDNDFPGGVWCFDPNKGFYHKYSVSSDRRLITNAVTTANVNTTTEIITVAGATVPATGTPVIYDDGANGAGTAIGGLTHREKYYVIYESDTTMKLATSKANADADTEIDLTGTGNNSQFFIFVGNRDFGGGKNEVAAGIILIKNKEAIPSDGTHLMFGGRIGKTSGTLKDVLCVAAAGQENRGAVVTARLDAQSVIDGWTVGIKFNGIKEPEDKIILKYKTAERNDNLKFLDSNDTLTGTWSDANTFTTTADLSAITAGDEVTVHAGTGAGYMLRIDSISEAGGTYTVNLTESVQNVTSSDTMLFTVDVWEYVGEIDTDDVDTVTLDEGTSFSTLGNDKEFTIETKSRYMQLKIEMRGEDVVVEDILVNNKPFEQMV